MGYEIGDMVYNDKTKEWGTGAVLEILGDDKYKIFFIHAGQKIINTQYANLQPATVTDQEKRLFGQIAFKKADLSQFRSFDQLAAKFLKLYPGGFEDEKYLTEERADKVEASELLATTLSKDIAKDLIAKDDFEAVCTLSSAIIGKTNLIFPNEITKLRNALKKEDNKAIYAKGLVDLLYGTGTFKARFEAFIAVLQKIDSFKWTIATYFPFLSQPEQYPYLKPKVVQSAANVFCFELNYKVAPNWKTYKSLMNLVQHVSKSLSERDDKLTPKDMMDIQSFIWVVGS